MVAYTFHAYAGARQNGKTSAARDAWQQAGCAWASAGRPGPGQLIDAGLVAEPLVIDDHDFRELSGEQITYLEQHAFAPGFVVRRIDCFGRPRIEIRWPTPCVTTLPARA